MPSLKRKKNIKNQPYGKLILEALRVRQHAYTPYSKYKVGASILTKDGKIFSGCNVENSAYGVTLCAERTALVKAVSEGHQQFTAIVVATENRATPCGCCRQVLAEFNPNIAIIAVDLKKNSIEYSLSQLLPHCFNSAIPK